eukprot:CAMPEP_0194205550 /NCGR_PEP_ID=MMETSP0156-20130528/4796_1 /TAXON_ID=33649 /ORGANISM="Thalassionema nitzschioides, Strain L26-B" /LENGTH=543 /DNA_ID=CAMNT_0038931853 /DNA_START=604 /DNA_END=2235 /DNA_ORIENTATION=+
MDAINDKSSAKRIKSDCTVPTLPSDIFTIILAHLDPQSLLRLASISSEMMNLLSHQLVIRNSVLQGGDNARINIQGLLANLQRKFIYMPSPIRMLRIVNGTFCECHGCHARVASLTTGLLFCEDCKKAKMGKYPGKMKRNKIYGSILSHDKIMGKFWSLPFVNKRPFRSTDRQRNGTIITKVDIERMVREDITVDEYFEDYLDHVEAPDTECVKRLIAVAEQAEKERNERNEELRSRKPETLIQIEESLAQIQGRLMGCAKHFAMDYKTSQPHWRISITYPLTRSLLGRITCHPRYATETRLIHVANSIDDAYDEIAASGFADFTCFSDDKIENPLEAKIRSYLCRNFTQGDEFLRHWRLDKYMLHRLNSTGPKSALVYFAFGGGWTSLPAPLMTILAEVVVEEGGNLENVSASREFIEFLHEVLAPNPYKLCVNWKFFQEYFEELLLTYKRLRPLILAYHSHPETVALCRSDGAKDQSCEDLSWGLSESHWKGIKRRIVLNMWVSKKDFYPVADWLIREDWLSLREYHLKHALRAARMYDML